ncbi:cytochrome P450 [Variovorax boronicumulans]|uniref:cytochrome P450 n=1 Tax=Variovorax boronicumulans TaxID=436515 RepID=UPI0027879425|nr:cytochrome P450 [Variovorax boronicumulans]MDP9913633.1 cytochrome P450 [Variovorax boronicumulans]
MLLNPLNRRTREQQGMPVLPGAFPVVGHLPAVLSGLHSLLAWGEKGWGTHFWLDMGRFGRMLVCTRPDAFEMLKNKHVLADLLADVAPPLKDTMATQDDEAHRKARAWTNASFLPQGLSGAKVGDLFADTMHEGVRRWTEGEPIRLVDEVSDMTLTMIFRMFGVPESDLPAWRTFYGDYFLVSTLPWSRTGRSQRAQAWIDQSLLKLIDDVRTRPEAGGLLAALMHALATTQPELDDANLLANLRALIHAAHKTTAVTMAQLVIALSRRPECWDRLCAEARAVGAVPRTPADLARFPYAEALFRETLRCHPAFPLIFRRAREDIDLAGRTVSAGSRLIVPLTLFSSNPAIYPQPGSFLPQRWLDRAEGLKPIDTLQFGNGPHRCLGYHTAWMQLVQFAVTLSLTLDCKGLHPQLLKGRAGRPRSFPLHYPPRATRIAFVPASMPPATRTTAPGKPLAHEHLSPTP